MDVSGEENSLVLDTSGQDDIPSGPLSPDADQEDDYLPEQEGEDADRSKEEEGEDEEGSSQQQLNESIDDAASGQNDEDAPQETDSQEQDASKEQAGSEEGSGDEQVESSPRKKRAVIESDDEDDMPSKKLRVESDNEDEQGDQSAKVKPKKATIMDSDEEDDDQPTQTHSKKKVVIESEDEEGEEDQPTKAQRRAVIESDEEEEKKEAQLSGDENEQDEERKPAKRTRIEDDSEEDEDKPKRGGDKELIADIFGESDGEEEFEGFDAKKARGDGEEESGDEHKQAEAAEGEEAQDALPDISSDEDEEDDRPRKVPEGMVYDFDIMMEKKKEENYRRRKRRNIDIINDSDDLIADLIREMKAAVEEDFQLNKNRQAATQKLKLLPRVDAYLKKIDLREALLDSGILSVLTDWLTPLPDRSLPHLNIREAVLKRLLEFNVEDTERLKASGIGKAVMYLYKHPKETKDNKKRALQLIKNWSRPIFNTDTDYASLSKEEREQRDIELNRKARRDSTDGDARGSSSRTPEEKPLRPGEKGWVPRARVPQPSTRDYVVRPKSTVEGEVKVGRSSRQNSRLDKHLRNFMEQKRKNKNQRAVKISIEGRGMLA